MKKVIIILLAVLLIAGGGIIGYQYNYEKEIVQGLEEDLRERYYDYLYIPKPDRLSFKNLSTRVDTAIESHVLELVRTEDYKKLNSFLNALEDEEYSSVKVKEILNAAFSKLSSFEEKADFLSTALVYADDYSQDMLITAKEMQEYIREQGENPVSYSRDSGGFYSEEENKKEPGRVYGKYGTYDEYGYNYYGDFCIEHVTDVYTVGGDYDLTTDVRYKSYLLFRDFRLAKREDLPAEGSCIYAGNYLFIDAGNEWEAYPLMQTHMGIPCFRVSK
jgi:hypothetical protein